MGDIYNLYIQYYTYNITALWLQRLTWRTREFLLHLLPKKSLRQTLLVSFRSLSSDEDEPLLFSNLWRFLSRVFSFSFVLKRSSRRVRRPPRPPDFVWLRWNSLNLVAGLLQMALDDGRFSIVLVVTSSPSDGSIAFLIFLATAYELVLFRMSVR